MSKDEEEEKARSNPFLAKKMGKGDTNSRSKAEKAADQTNERTEIAVGNDSVWPTNDQGRPLARVTMTASELIPTGQYANVSVGPAQITMFIDPDSDQPLTPEQAENVGKALNVLAEIVEVDVVAVQRNLVLESLQQQIASG